MQLAQEAAQVLQRFGLRLACPTDQDWWPQRGHLYSLHVWTLHPSLHLGRESDAVPAHIAGIERAAELQRLPYRFRQCRHLVEEIAAATRDRAALNNVIDLASRMAHKDHGRQMPDSIKGDDDAQAVFGIVEPVLTRTANGDGASEEDTADIAKRIVGIIREHHIVDVWSNEVAQNNMRNAIDDYFFDVVRDQKGIDIPLEQLDELELQIMDVARARFPG